MIAAYVHPEVCHSRLLSVCLSLLLSMLGQLTYSM
jgi:hypothetical protein